MAILIKQNILRFQIPVKYSMLMKVAQSFYELGGVYLCPCLCELVLFLKVCEKFAAVEEINN